VKGCNVVEATLATILGSVTGGKSLAPTNFLLGKRHFARANFRNIYTSALLVIARSTEKELARQMSYLKAENQILPFLLPSPRFGEKGWG
jgi:hypothetical protein